MRTYLTALMIVMAVIPTVHAGDHKLGYDQGCFYDSKKKKNGSKSWHYWYCGSQSVWCAGKKGKGSSSDVLRTIYDQQEFTFESDPQETYCCCGGSPSSQGVFRLGHCRTSTEASRTEIKSLGDGEVCRQYYFPTVCGWDTLVDCNEPDTELCEAGYVKRNKKCVPMCEGGLVFDSATSSTCVECKLTQYQGVRQDKYGSYCLRCNQASEFFDKRKEECVKKDSLKIISTLAMGKCWKCSMEDKDTCALLIEKDDEAMRKSTMPASCKR